MAKYGDEASLLLPDTSSPTTQVSNGFVNVKAFAKGNTDVMSVRAIVYTGTVPPADTGTNYTDLPHIGNDEYQNLVPDAPLDFFRIHLIATFEPAGASDPPRTKEDDRGYFLGV